MLAELETTLELFCAVLFCWEETQLNQHKTMLGLHWLPALDSQKKGRLATAPRCPEPGGDAAIFALFCFSLHPLSPGSSQCLRNGNSQFQSKHFSFRKSKWPTQSGSDRVDCPSRANHWAQFFRLPWARCVEMQGKDTEFYKSRHLQPDSWTAFDFFSSWLFSHIQFSQFTLNSCQNYIQENIYHNDDLYFCLVWIAQNYIFEFCNFTVIIDFFLKIMNI